jgi:hypothetical protein
MYLFQKYFWQLIGNIRVELIDISGKRLGSVLVEVSLSCCRRHRPAMFHMLGLFVPHSVLRKHLLRKYSLLTFDVVAHQYYCLAENT